MHIEFISIKGFKSFGPEQEIGPFGHGLNVIVGLNGSGKFNLLAAIQFVLCPNEWRALGVQNLKQLLHRSPGYTQFTEAAVSIVVTYKNDGSNENKMTLGRTINERGISKYFMDGQLKSSQDFFAVLGELKVNTLRHSIIRQKEVSTLVTKNETQLFSWINAVCLGPEYQFEVPKKLVDENEKMMKTWKDKPKQHLEFLKCREHEAEAAAPGVVSYSQSVEELRVKQQQLDLLKYQATAKKLRDAEALLRVCVGDQKSEQESLRSMEEEIAKCKSNPNWGVEREAEIRAELNSATTEYKKCKKSSYKKEAEVHSAGLNKEDAEEKVAQAKEDYEKEAKEVEEYKVKNQALIDEFASIQQEIKVAEENLSKVKDIEEKIHFGNLVTDSGDIVNVGERLNVVTEALAEAHARYKLSKKEFTTVNNAVQERVSQLRHYPEDDAELACRQAQQQEKQNVFEGMEFEISNLATEKEFLQGQLKNAECLREKNLKDNTAAMEKWEKALQSAKIKYEAKKNVFEDIRLDLRAQTEFLNGLQEDIDEATNELKMCEDILQEKQEESGQVCIWLSYLEYQLKEVEQVIEKNQNNERKIYEYENRHSELQKSVLLHSTAIKEKSLDVLRLGKQLEKLKPGYVKIGSHTPPSWNQGESSEIDALSREVEKFKMDVENKRLHLHPESTKCLETNKNKIQQFEERICRSRLDDLHLLNATIQKGSNAQIIELYKTINRNLQVLLEKVSMGEVSEIAVTPINPQNPKEGCRLSVSIGKEKLTSLSRLSSGQKAIIGILFLLGMKFDEPSPLYIFDKVDDYLDKENTKRFLAVLGTCNRSQFFYMTCWPDFETPGQVLFETRKQNGVTFVTRRQ